MEQVWMLIILVVWAKQTSQTQVTQNETFTPATQDVTITLNTQRPRHLTGEKFLSLSVSPWLLSTGNYSSATVNMLRGLAPAYLRVEGIREEDNKELILERPPNSSESINLTEAEWRYIHQLSVDTGLKLILSLSSEKRDDPNLASHLLTLSQKLGYTPICQLSYKMAEMNRTAALRGQELGKELVQLRKMVKSVSPFLPPPGVLGPDVVKCDSSDCGHFLSDFLLETNNSPDAIIFQMIPHKEQSEENVLEQMTEPVESLVKMVSSKEALISLSQKQLWIAETSEHGYTREFSDALIWALRLGEAASLGYRTILHSTTQLNHPTPDYWVSLLYRNLVGRTVLRVHLQPPSNTTIFSHCTMVSSELIQQNLTSAQYGYGTATVWGVNTAHDSVRLSLNVGVREGTVHLYILTAADEHDSGLRKTLLNGQLLQLTEAGELPKINPKILSFELSSVSVPPRSVFFIIFPDLKARACLYSPINQGSLSVNTLPIIKPPSSEHSVSLRKEGKEESDYTLEKGGLLRSIQTVEASGDVLKNRMRSNSDMNTRVREQDITNGAKENIRLRKQHEELKNNKSSPGEQVIKEESALKIRTAKLINDDWLSKLDRINSSGILTKEEFRTLSDLLSLDKQMTGEKLDQYSSLPSKLDEDRNIHEGHLMLPAKEKTVENVRFKRSEDDGYLTRPSTSPQFDIPPLYKRINLLRQKKPYAIFSTTPKSEMSEQRSQEFFQTNPLNKPDSKTPVKLQNNLKLSSTSENKDSPSSLQYLPGEFYETLGGLKLDSNTSLRDVEDPHEAIASVSNESKCKGSNSKLKVSKKPVNRYHLDSKIIENATEQMKQYYGSTEDIQMKSDVSGGIENDMKCHLGKKKLNDENQSKDKVTEESSTSDDKNTNRDPKKSSFHDLERIKEDPSTVSLANMSSSRMKREITRTLQIKSSKKKYNESSEERELNTFLDELTVEGEQLLKSVNQGEKGDKSKQSDAQTKPVRNQSVPTPSLPNEGNKFLSNFEEIKLSPDGKNSSDHSGISNSLNDIAIKPKRKYTLKHELNSKLPFGSINLNKNKKKEIKFQNGTNNLDIISISIPIPKVPVEISKSKGVDPETILKELNSSHPSEVHDDSEKLVETSRKDAHKGGANESVFLQTTITGFPRVYMQHNLQEIPHANTSTKLMEITNLPKENIDALQFKETEKNEEYEVENNSSTVKNSILLSKLTDGLSTTHEENNIVDVNDGDKITKTDNPHVVTNLPLKPNLKFNLSGISDLPVLAPSLNTYQLPHIDAEIDKTKDLTSKTQLTNAIDSATSLSSKLSALHRERIEAFKAKLEKAKQRLFNGGSTKLVVKREIPSSPQVTNGIHYKDNGIETNELKKNGLDSLKNNYLVRYLEKKMLSPLTYEPDLTHRLTRQIPDLSLGIKKTKLVQERNSKSKQLEFIEDNKKQPNSPMEPTYLSPLNKWIIPLSNYTENIVLNNRVFPVKLYGILSDDWIQREKDSKSNNIIQDMKRVPRSIRYKDPCKRDRFNYFESEEENDSFHKNSNLNSKRVKSEDVIEYTGQQKSTEKHSPGKQENVDIKTSPLLAALVSQIKSNERTKRSVNDDIVRNEIEMKALLTNEIVKEGPLNDGSRDDHTESHSGDIFKSMLQKTMLKAVSNNKTGLDKMYELAKQYQKTNPSSLETFNDQLKKIKEHHDVNEEGNKAMEVLDTSYEVQRSSLIKNNTHANQEVSITIKSPVEMRSAVLQEQNKNGIKHTKTSKNDILTSFLKKINDFFKVITAMVKKSFT